MKNLLKLKMKTTSRRSRPERNGQPSRRTLIREGVHRFPLRTTGIVAPLQFTRDATLAWYVLGPLNWEFLTLVERVGAWDVQRSRYGQAAEAVDAPRRFHLRRTTRPYGAYRWAVELHRASDPLPDVEGAENFDTYCVHAQNRLNSASLDQRATMIGVEVAGPQKQAVIDELTGGRAESAAAKDILAALTELDGLFADEAETAGFRAHRATSADLGFLWHRSLSMGLPTPAGTGDGVTSWAGLGEFTDRSEWVTVPPPSRPRSGLADTVQVTGRVPSGDIETRHVVAVTMGEMPDLTWPEQGNDGWLMASDWLGFPVEWSVNGHLVRGSTLDKITQRESVTAQDMADHYLEHGQTPPPSTTRAITAAIRVHDQVTTGDTREAPRFQGTVRAAVYGHTPEEAKANANALITHMKDKARMPMHITLDQVRALREFVPGEPHVLQGWSRRMSVGYLAAGMPHVDAEVGTEKGPYLGFSVLSRRAVLFDPHWAMENNYPGLVTVAGEPGAGKSFFTGIMTYNMVMTGKRVTVCDPSGPLRSLTKMPELAPYAAELNLSRADDGTLSPPAMIPIPRKDNFLNADGVVDDFEFRQETRRAEAEAAQLSFDTLRMWLTPSLAVMPGVDRRLSDALDSMAHHPRARTLPRTMWNLRWAVEQLRRGDDLAGQIAHELEVAARFPGSSLIMPEHSDPVEYAGLDEKRLVVITMPGVAAPSGENIGAAERYAIPLIHLASFFATRSVYSRPRDEQKAVMLDEGDTLVQHPSGKYLVNRLGSDSRKWNTAVFFASQDPQDSSAVGKRLRSLVGAQVVFRLRNSDAAAKACEALNVAPGYAGSIQGLQTGQAVLKDPSGRVAKIVVDKWHPSFDLLNTTPRPRRAAYSLGLPPAPAMDPRLFEEIAA